MCTRAIFKPLSIQTSTNNGMDVAARKSRSTQEKKIASVFAMASAAEVPGQVEKARKLYSQSVANISTQLKQMRGMLQDTSACVA